MKIEIERHTKTLYSIWLSPTTFYMLNLRPILHEVRPVKIKIDYGIDPQ